MLCFSLGFAAVLGMWYLVGAAFLSHPTGYYIKANESGYVSEVYQDIKYGEDRLVFTGPNGAAWEAYRYLTKPEAPVPVPRYQEG